MKVRRLARAAEAVLRQWLGAQWAGLFVGVPSYPEPLGALKRHRSRAGALPRGHFDHAVLLRARRVALVGEGEQLMRLGLGEGEQLVRLLRVHHRLRQPRRVPEVHVLVDLVGVRARARARPRVRVKVQ
eukprot:scaffold10461_cov65-Phaeocystis_antarctica.AAC.1